MAAQFYTDRDSGRPDLTLSQDNLNGEHLHPWIYPPWCRGEMDTSEFTGKMIAALLVVSALLLLPGKLAAQVNTEQTAAADQTGVIGEIVFVGLRRVSCETLQSKIRSRRGDTFDQGMVERDARILARTGWFEMVRADIEPVANPGKVSPRTERTIRLTFYATELPFLAGVEYRGSRLLSTAQMEKLLAERNLKAKLGEPANPSNLFRIARETENALRDLGHPDGHVSIVEEKSANYTVRVRFEISDGPHLPVGRVEFAGDPEISRRKLQRQMRRVNPSAWFAGLRGTNAFTRKGFEEDRRDLLEYYQNHGYPEARIGDAEVVEYEQGRATRRLWKGAAAKKKLEVTIPVHAGRFYRTGATEASPALARASGFAGDPRELNSRRETGRAFSAQETENLRRGWEMRVRAKSKERDAETLREVEVIRTLDSGTGLARVRFDLSAAAPYRVRRLEFRGMQHFPDRYFRRRIGVKEGAALDERALEAGLARLARTGYFKPIKKEDIRIEPDEPARTVDVSIRVEELGKQRLSMVGGRGQFGSTVGVAYSLFNLFDREELLSSKIEGGPETLELALGFAKEGFLGSRGSLAISVFNTFLRPRLTGSVKGPFFRMRSEGAGADYSYALSGRDVLSASYGLAYSDTSYSLQGPAGSSGLTIGGIHAKSSSRTISAGWTRNSGGEEIVLADSASGGWLGGSENLLRSKAEYGRIFRDPLFSNQNAWAFRTTFSGVGSYSGAMPITARWFSGDEYVRGLRDGELGPQALVAWVTPSEATRYASVPAGSDLIGAENAEYRVRLGGGTEATGFFDAGSGLLLPNWLGKSKSTLFDSTNGIVHGSTGVELRWTLPGIGVPLRAYYAVNVLRLNRSVMLPDNSLLRLHNRFGAFGWGLGSLF